MKVGDILYCWNNIFPDTTSVLSLSIGMEYEVIKIMNTSLENGIMIYDNSGREDWYSNYEEDRWYYGNWFWTLSDIRRVKLERINIINDESRG